MKKNQKFREICLLAFQALSGINVIKLLYSLILVSFATIKLNYFLIISGCKNFFGAYTHIPHTLKNFHNDFFFGKDKFNLSFFSSFSFTNFRLRSLLDLNFINNRLEMFHNIILEEQIKRVHRFLVYENKKFCLGSVREKLKKADNFYTSFLILLQLIDFIPGESFFSDIYKGDEYTDYSNKVKFFLNLLLVFWKNVLKYCINSDTKYDIITDLVLIWISSCLVLKMKKFVMLIFSLINYLKNLNNLHKFFNIFKKENFLINCGKILNLFLSLLFIPYIIIYLLFFSVFYLLPFLVIYYFSSIFYRYNLGKKRLILSLEKIFNLNQFFLLENRKNVISRLFVLLKKNIICIFPEEEFSDLYIKIITSFKSILFFLRMSAYKNPNFDLSFFFNEDGSNDDYTIYAKADSLFDFYENSNPSRIKLLLFIINFLYILVIFIGFYFFLYYMHVLFSNYIFVPYLFFVVLLSIILILRVKIFYKILKNKITAYYLVLNEGEQYYELFGNTLFSEPISKIIFPIRERIKKFYFELKFLSFINDNVFLEIWKGFLQMLISSFRKKILKLFVVLKANFLDNFLLCLKILLVVAKYSFKFFFELSYLFLKIISKIKIFKKILIFLSILILLSLISIKLFFFYLTKFRKFESFRNKRFVGVIDLFCIIFTVIWNEGTQKISNNGNNDSLKIIPFNQTYSRFLKTRFETPDEIYRKFYSNKYLQMLSKEGPFIYILKDFEKKQHNFKNIYEKNHDVKKLLIEDLIHFFRFKRKIKVRKKQFYKRIKFRTFGNKFSFLRSEIPTVLVSNKKFRDIYFREFVLRKFIFRKKMQTFDGRRSLWIKRWLDNFESNISLKKSALFGYIGKTHFRNNIPVSNLTRLEFYIRLEIEKKIAQNKFLFFSILSCFFNFIFVSLFVSYCFLNLSKFLFSLHTISLLFDNDNALIIDNLIVGGSLIPIYFWSILNLFRLSFRFTLDFIKFIIHCKFKKKYHSLLLFFFKPCRLTSENFTFGTIFNLFLKPQIFMSRSDKSIRYSVLCQLRFSSFFLAFNTVNKKFKNIISLSIFFLLNIYIYYILIINVLAFFLSIYFTLNFFYLSILGLFVVGLIQYNLIKFVYNLIISLGSINMKIFKILQNFVPIGFTDNFFYSIDLNKKNFVKILIETFFINKLPVLLFSELNFYKPKIDKEALFTELKLVNEIEFFELEKISNKEEIINKVINK